MEYIKIGNIVNTHALKGELRILSDFEYKDKVFIIGNPLFIGRFKTKEIIETYRCHKNYDMVKFIGKDYINDVIAYKGEAVYIEKVSIKLNDDELLISDIVGMKVVYDNKEIGVIDDYRNDNGNKIIKVNDKYIPFNKDFIERIDKNNKIIYYKGIGGLL